METITKKEEVLKYEALINEGHKASASLLDALEHLTAISNGLGYRIPIDAYQASIKVLLKEAETLTKEAENKLSKRKEKV